MTKVTEAIHYQTEKFTLTQVELTEALRRKYGDEPVFSSGRLAKVDCYAYFEPSDIGYDTHITYETNLK